MTSSRFAGQQIESWNPAADIRSVEAGRLFILNGKNYYFDSKGPKSGFGTRLVRGGALGKLSDIQSVDIDKQTLVGTSNGIYRQEYANANLTDVLESSTWWRKLFTFDETVYVPQFADGRWTGAFVNGTSFIAHPSYGLYTIGTSEATLHTADGVPGEPIAIALLASRLIVLTREGFYWSGPGDGSDFVPQLGGAGVQLNSQYLSGEPIGLTVFEQGCVVWTANSAMVVEYIGGNSVFRFDTLQTKLHPVGPLAITADSNGRTFMLTRHGIVLVENAGIREDVLPEFNQFIRTYFNENTSLKARLDYILEDDLLYVQLADSNSYFQETFVLSVAIDKWGQFNEEHLGICRYGAQQGSTGYADTDGYMHKFTGTPDREKRGQGLVGLDSYIDVGYLNNPSMVIEADTILELQELMLSARVSFPPNADLQIIDLQGEGDWWGVVTGPTTVTDLNAFDAEEVWSLDMNSPWEGWDGETAIIDPDDPSVEEGEDVIIDPDDPSEDEGEDSYPMYMDLNYFTAPDYDLNLGYLEGTAFDLNKSTLDLGIDMNHPPMSAQVVPQPFQYEDWNVPDGDEDWNGPYSLLNFVGYQLLCMSSIHGFQYDIDVEPSLALEYYNRDLWTMITSGRFQSIRISALDPWEKFHLTQIDASITYQGQYS